MKRQVCAAWAVILLAGWRGDAAGTWSSPDESPVHVYRRSPGELHRRIRHLLREGQSPGALVTPVATATGDYSFAPLRIARPELIHALKLQEEARLRWEEGRQDGAFELYRAAFRALEATGVRSERAFCLYLMAEIRAEQERHEECLSLLGRALVEIEGRSCWYFEALIRQSLGYSLWHLDRLPESTGAFAEAAHLWRKIGYPEAILACHNNLATIYETLGLDRMAEASYLNALAELRRDTFPETRIRLLLNTASILHRQGDGARSRRFLELALRDRELLPAECALVEAEVTGQPERLHDIRNQEPSFLAEREYLLLRLRSPAKYDSVAEWTRLLNYCRSYRLPRLEREAARELGQALERSGRWDEAAAHYEAAIRKAGLMITPDWVFPLPEALEPHLRGWIRALVRSGRPWTALRRIRAISAARFRLLESASWQPGESEDPEDEWAAFRRLTQTPTEASSWGPEPANILPADTTVVEFWPDGDEILTWVQGAGCRRFLRLLNFPELEHVDGIAGVEGSLPPPPSAAVLETISKRLFGPIFACVRGSRLLVLPHGRLQRTPFEVLPTPSGIPIGEQWAVSYLPAWTIAEPSAEVDGREPAAVLSSRFSRRSGGKLEQAFLAGRTPPAKRYTNPQDLPSALRVRWLHWSSHLHRHPRHWFRSVLSDGDWSLPLTDLLWRRIDCRLLSLAVCDGASADGLTTQDWLGLSALLLSRGSRSLLLSRWRLDERSAELFIDTLAGVEAGLAVDEALALARRTYLKRHGGDPVRRHPYFWAGVIHVGTPGH